MNESPNNLQAASPECNNLVLQVENLHTYFYTTEGIVKAVTVVLQF